MLKKYLRKRARKDGINSISNAVYNLIQPPSRNRKFPQSPDMVFIWIPKTAGSSVFNFLNKELGMQKLKTSNHALSFSNRGAVTFGHLHYMSLLHFGIVSHDFHNRAFKFSFVRDPYSRVASLYNYLTRRNLIDGQCFDRFLDSVFLRPPVGMYNRIGLSQTNPQTDWLMGASGTLLVDRIFKVEDLDGFASYFQEKHSLKFVQLERLNASAQVVTVDDIIKNVERTERINEMYARDFDLLGYEKVVFR